MKKFTARIKAFAKTKYGKVCMCMCALSSLMVGSCFAAEGDAAAGTIDASAITTAFTTGFQSIVTNSISMLAAMLPIALSLCAVLFIVRKGMTWFKQTAK